MSELAVIRLERVHLHGALPGEVGSCYELVGRAAMRRDHHEWSLVELASHELDAAAYLLSGGN